MLAKDIKPEEIYALDCGAQGMHRFKVTAVVSVRTRASLGKSDVTKSYLNGYDQDDKVERKGVEVTQIIGSYLAHEHLVEREKAEKAELEAKITRQKEELEHKRQVLYRTLGLRLPPAEEPNQLFSVRYGQRVEPSTEGWELLIKYLENRELQIKYLEDQCRAAGVSIP